MLRLLRTRRWLSFTAVVIIVIIAFGLLSRWQWSRAEEKQVLNSSMVSARDHDPVAPINAATEWTPVRITGSYDSASEVVVRKRPQETINGFWVMTPLESADGTVWINRGWLRADGNATTYPDVPPAPEGEVTVTGLWRDWQQARTTSGLPQGMISDVDPVVLPVSTPLNGFVQLTESQPEQTGLAEIQLPEIDDVQNISYAVQWILFALVCIGGWFFFLRREAREDSRKSAQED
jgi:cytochrome oxidase assembly protein ShyY1